MNWRDRLALWLLRKIAPGGLGQGGAVLVAGFDSGRSTQDDPALVMRVQTTDGQMVLSLVVDVDYMCKTIERFRSWANAS